MEHKDGNLNSANAINSPPAYSATESNPPPTGDAVDQPTLTTTTVNYPNISAIPVVTVRPLGPYHQIIPNTAPIVTVIVERPRGPYPQIVVCKSCNNPIQTRIIRKATTKTHITAAVLCVLGGLLCVWLPYCMKACRNADHYCPECDAYIGSYIY